MGIETALIAGSLAVSAASAANGISTANAQGKIAQQSAAEQVRANFSQQQLAELQKTLAMMDHSLNQSQTADQKRAAELQGQGMDINEQQLEQKRQLLGLSAARLQQDALQVTAQVQLANAGLDIQAAQTERGLIDGRAQTMAKAATDIATARVLAGEAGWSGGSLVAAIREIAHVEGTNLGQLAAKAGDDLAQIQQERTKANLQGMAQMNDLGRQQDALTAQGQQVTADQQRAIIARGQLDLTADGIQRDAAREEVNYQRQLAGITTQQTQLETQQNLINLNAQSQQIQAGASATNAVLGTIGSGLQIASGYYASERQKEAVKKLYAGREAVAKNER